MKKIGFLVLMLIGILISSCNKDDSVVSNSIVGEWLWTKSYGGFSGADLQTPESSGVNKKMIFLVDGSFYMVENSDTVFQTNYFTSREKSILFHDTFNFVTVNYNYRIPGSDSVLISPMRYIIQTLNDTLEVTEDVFDGYGHQYVRSK
jgi:hypothetical protein